MRRQALEATHYIPYKLIQSLSSHSTTIQNQSTTTVEGKARVEKEVQIRLENDILKYGINDSILVNSAVIWLSPGKLIFILEPTKSQFLQRQFKLETELKVHHKGNLFLVDEIAYSDKPIHPILYTSFLSVDPSYQPPVTGFDWEMETHWNKPAQTPEEYAAHFANPLIAKVRCRDGYLPMILDNGEKAIPVTAKPFDGEDLNHWGKPSKFNVASTSPMYVLLETRSYFERRYFDIEKGCVLRDDMKELVCTDVQYPFFPYHPVLTVSA